MSNNRFNFFRSENSYKFLGSLVLIGSVLGLIIGAGLLMAPDEKGEKRPSNKEIMDYLEGIAAKHNCTVESFAKYFWDTVYNCVDENGKNNERNQWKAEDETWKYLKRFQSHTNQDLMLAGILTITVGTFVGGPVSGLLLWLAIGLLVSAGDILQATGSLVRRTTNSVLTNTSSMVNNCLRLTQGANGHERFEDEDVERHTAGDPQAISTPTDDTTSSIDPNGEESNNSQPSVEETGKAGSEHRRTLS